MSTTITTIHGQRVALAHLRIQEVFPHVSTNGCYWFAFAYNGGPVPMSASQLMRGELLHAGAKTKSEVIADLKDEFAPVVESIAI